MKAIRILSRVVVGLVFVFSGFVKLVDPLGSAYKFNDYFNAFHMGFMEPFTLVLALILPISEFLIGACLILGLRMKLMSWAVLIFMSFFTVLTFFLALFNPVTDCGCFGDALIITNWETFGKNVILMILALFIFISRKKYIAAFNNKLEWGITGIFLIMGLWITVYSYNHLPIIDFRPYKIGTSIPEGMSIPDSQKNNVDQYETTLIYKKNGQLKEFDIKNLPDSTWQWVETKNKLIKEGYHPPIHNFSISTVEGSEITDIVLSDTSHNFLLISYNLEKASKEHQKQINDIAGWCQANGIPFRCITSSTKATIDEFKKITGAQYEFCTADEITLKTIIRSNPGLLLLKHGTVINMWHHNDLPDVKKLNKNLSSIAIKHIKGKSEKYFTVSLIFLFLFLSAAVVALKFYLKSRRLE